MKIEDLKFRASKGDAVAQFKLGHAYENGLGVPLDEKAAIKLYEWSASQGNRKAKISLETLKFKRSLFDEKATDDSQGAKAQKPTQEIDLLSNIPNGSEFPNRSMFLKDMLVWAIGAGLIEGLQDVTEDLLKKRSIPVLLTAKGEKIIQDASDNRLVAWGSGIDEDGIQINGFAKSEQVKYFEMINIKCRRKGSSYTKYELKKGEWCRAYVSHWKNSLPKAVLDALDIL